MELQLVQVKYPWCLRSSRELHADLDGVCCESEVPQATRVEINHLTGDRRGPPSCQRPLQLDAAKSAGRCHIATLHIPMRFVAADVGLLPLEE